MRLSDEPWVESAEARAAFIAEQQDAAMLLSVADHEIARVIGRCRHAALPALIEWLASELRAYTKPAEILTALNVLTVPLLGEVAERTLQPSRVATVPEMSARQLQDYLREELAA